MSIKYFPNRVFKKNVHATDKSVEKKPVNLIRGAANIYSNAFSTVISSNTDWQLNTVKLTFSTATSKDYSVKILGGIKIVTNLNDYLWFQAPNVIWQKITLSEGFYTGTQLAAQLKTKMDANTAFTSAGITFTVTYTAETGLFLITPSVGTIKYLSQVPLQLSERDSIAGHLFGLNATTAFASSITSDTPAYGLNQESWMITATGSVVTEHLNTDQQILSLDQALHIATTNASGTIFNYEIGFKEID